VKWVIFIRLPDFIFLETPEKEEEDEEGKKKHSESK
jgi:hypothetical protein